MSQTYSLSGKRAYVAGDRGMVGSAIVRRLAREDCTVVTADRSVDLREQSAVRDWFAAEQPDIVFLAAARVGGIVANATYPAQFLYDNLMIETNIIDAAKASQSEKLVFLGSSCIYPRDARQPMSEEALLTGPLEETNQWYAIAKIAGIKLCDAYRREYGCDFISAMPTNLYGPGDNYDLATSHVLPALIRKAHEAKEAGQAELPVWGTGTPLREFLHVDDLADACVFLAQAYSEEGHVNVGSGAEISIGDLARMVCDIVGFQGEIPFQTDKPDGTPRKLMDSSKLNGLGWSAEIALQDGIEAAYREFLGAGQMREVSLEK